MIFEHFYATFSSGEIPQIWNIAQVLPQNKTDYTCDLKHRPISKLSPVSKILESLFKSQLCCLCEANDVLLPQQSGFAPAWGTITAAAGVAWDIINSLDKKQHSLYFSWMFFFNVVDHDDWMSCFLRG